MPPQSGVWADVDALLAEPPPRPAGTPARSPVWDDVDALLSESPATSSTISDDAPAVAAARRTGQMTPLELATIAGAPTTQASAQMSAPVLPRIPPPPGLPAEGVTDPASVRVTDAPVPVAARGFTDPASLKVTEAPVPPPATYARGRMAGLPIPRGGADVTVPSSTAADITGVEQMAHGAGGLAHAARHPSTALNDTTLDAASDVIEGAFKAMLPLAAGATVAAPLATGVTVAATLAASKVGQLAVSAMGGTPAEQRFGAAVASLLAAGGVGADQFSRFYAKAKADLHVAADAVRADPTTGVSLKVGPFEIPLRRPTLPEEGPPPAPGELPAADVPPAADQVPRTTLSPGTVAQIDSVLDEGPGTAVAPAASAPPVESAAPAGGFSPGTAAQVDAVLAETPPALPAPTEASRVGAAHDVEPVPAPAAESASPPAAPGDRTAAGAAPDQTLSGPPGSQAGPRVPDTGPQQPVVDQGGPLEGPRDGARAESRGVPASPNDRFAPPPPYEAFVRAPVVETAARLTPAVRLELERIKDELSTFPYTARTWTWLDPHAGPKSGNAAGGNADIVAGSAGAKVYDDIKYLAPSNRVTSGARKGELAKDSHDTRAQVEAAVAKLLDSGDVHNNLAEGALRVAERRAAGAYRDVGRPELPPHWGTPIGSDVTDALSAALDEPSDSIDAGEGDTSFDPAQLEGAPADTLDTGEQQPRLPGDVGAVRQQETTTPAITEAPFSLEREPATRTAVEPDLFARPAPARKPSPPVGPRSSGGGVAARPIGTTPADASGALTSTPAQRALSLLTPGERQLRPSEIVTQLSQALNDLPIKVGKFRQPALGIYKIKPQVIRLKVANDLDTLAHEFGHHIHEALLGGELPAKDYRDELLAIGAPTSLPSYSVRQKLAEGQAEFTRHYLSDPATAQARAPIYYAAFERGLAEHPELEAVVQRAQRQYTGYLAQDPVTRGLARIDFRGTDVAPKADLMTRFQTAWVDDLYPLARMVNELADHQPVDVTASGYALARLARGAAGKADGFLRFGPRDTDGTFITPVSLEAALKPVRGEMREFAAYLVASHVPEVRAQDKETGMTLSEAAAIRAKYQSPTFDAARQAVYDYQDGLLEYARRAGVLTGDQIAAMRALYQSYVPFQRVYNEVGAGVSGAGSGKVGNRASPIKRLKGSGRDIINPLESIVRNTHTLVTMVEQNRAMQALVHQAEATTGGGRFLERIPDKQVATTFNLDQVASHIRKELDAAGVDVPDNLDFDKLVTVFTPTQFRVGEKGIVSVIRQGNRQWFAVNDPALYDAIVALGPAGGQDLVTRLLAAPARWLRAGATTTLGFAFRHPGRGTWMAFVNSRYGFRLGYDTVRGLVHYLKQDALYQQFLNSGAGNAALVSGDRDRVRAGLARLGGAERRRFADSVVLNPLHLLQAITEASDAAARLGEFQRGLEHEGAGAEAQARAGLAARDVAIDFARGGAASRSVNRIHPFFNAIIQGLARMREVFSSDPWGATTRAVFAITIPSILLWVLNHDDPAYHELPEWERNAYWHIPVGRGTGHAFVKVPKPYTLGPLFGNVAEAVLDAAFKADPHGLRRVLPDTNSAWKLFLGVVPTTLLPILEAGANYDTFRDRAIVNPDDQKLDTALQYNRWTSELAKFVGPKIGLAPAKLDHLIYGYGAGVAAGLAASADTAAGALGLTPKQKPAAGASHWPLVGAFYRETPGADAQSLEDFYRLRDQAEGAVGSIRRYQKIGDASEAIARRDRAAKELGPDPAATLTRVRQAATALAEARDGVNQVFANRALDQDEKKELLDRAYEQMVNIARLGLGEPRLPSRFAKPPDPALLEKLRAPKAAAPVAGRAPSGVVGSPASAGAPTPAAAAPPKPAPPVAPRPAPAP